MLFESCLAEHRTAQSPKNPFLVIPRPSILPLQRLFRRKFWKRSCDPDFQLSKMMQLHLFSVTRFQIAQDLSVTLAANVELLSSCLSPKRLQQSWEAEPAGLQGRILILTICPQQRQLDLRLRLLSHTKLADIHQANWKRMWRKENRLSEWL